MSNTEQYTVGWICALQTEYLAARAFLEKRHNPPEKLSPNDNNHYTLGEIRGHQVVIAVLPHGEYGTSSAACVVRDLLHSFPNIRFGLLVGIGGGAPTKQDIRLGDIIVSSPQSGHGGLLQYDFGKEIQDRGFHQTGFLNQPPTILRTAVSGLQVQYEEEGHHLKESIQSVLESNDRLRRKYAPPAPESDRLYDSQYTHLDFQSNCTEICDKSKLIHRSHRIEDEDNPAIHYGLIASGNRLIKDAIFRDKLAAEQGVLCFETEAAGLMNHFPCLVVRGVCDYADSHETKDWQGYAAMTAAAYAKDLLHQIAPQRVSHERKAIEAIRGIQDQLNAISSGMDKIYDVTNRSDLEIKSIAQGLNLKELPVAEGAEFGTYMDQHEEECLQGTREELLYDIDEWAAAPGGKCIFWLNGLAGTGKSTISRTVAKSFKKRGLLGASFFFKRGEGYRGSATRFFTTIANQLTRIPGLLIAITQVIRDNPGISDKPLKEQFEKLIHQPLRNLNRSESQETPLIIVVDALDECEGDNDIKVILPLLPRVQEANGMQLRFFITSRPELPIRLGFRTIQSSHQDLILHEIEKPIMERDISLFLRHKLAQIREERALPWDWPGNTALQALISMSVPLFIFAATICRLFEDHDLDPAECLMDVLKFKNEESRLDGTYLPVFERLVHKPNRARREKLIREVREVIGTIILLESPLSVVSLSQLTGISIASIYARINSLHSVLDIPTDKERPVRTFHLSFRDFLLDPGTKEKTPFWINERDTHQYLTTRCLSIMGRKLKKNICEFECRGTERRNVNNQDIRDCLPPQLQYSCRYWTHHLIQSRDAMSRSDEILSFLTVHFLHWVEAMSLLGAISEVLRIINTLKSAMQDKEGSKINEFLCDGVRFIQRNSQIVDIAPLQLYVSGLMFAPRMTIIRQTFAKDIPAWIHSCPRVEDTWGPELRTLEGHSSVVRSVSFSPNGRQLASGSQDKTIKIWDPDQGNLKHTLIGHSDSVWSVAFSPDGQQLASSSIDNTIKIWDPTAGYLKHTLEGHSDSVWSVAFSPDGQQLASGSSDKTIKIWDPDQGNLKHTLKGHSDSVCSVTFSPDGQQLASGSYDNTIKIWDPARGHLKHTLKGYSNSTQPVTFSPDSQQLASTSGSPFNIIKIWDTAIGHLKHILKGHFDGVQSVTFSPNGQQLASGSLDNTIKIWDPARGHLTHTLEGHSNLVCSVTFSLDGQQLASGSSDRTIKIWDPTQGNLKHTLEGHSHTISSVAFSPDGQQLASGSVDNTIKIWDPVTGLLGETLDTMGIVRSICFSQDATRLITNLGNFNIQPRLQDSSSSSTTSHGHISIQSGKWVVIQGKTEIWLPREYRPSHSAVYHKVLALGCDSGKVCFIHFSI